MPPLTAHLALTICAGLPAGAAAVRLAAAYAPVALSRQLQVLAMTGMVLVFAWASLTIPWGPVLAAGLTLGWTLGCLALIDVIAFRLPDAFTVPLTALGLAVSLALPGRPVIDHLFGAGIGWAVLTLIAWTYRRLRGRDGLGAGDAKLLAAAGAWLGWAALPSVILIACAATFVWVAIAAVARGRAELNARLAFGAPLCLAILFVWLQGPLVV